MIKLLQCAPLAALMVSGLLVAPRAAEAPVIQAAPAFTAAQLVAPPTNSWLTNGGNLYNQRYSPLTQLNRDNVKDLKAVWRASLRGSGLDRKTSGQAQMLAHEGVLYVITGMDDAFAISVDTRRRAVGIQGESRSREGGGLLRLGRARRRHGRWPHLHRPARQPGDRAGPENRQGAVAHAEPDACRRRLFHHHGAALLRRHGDHRPQRRRHGQSRRDQGLRRPHRQGTLALVHRARARRARQRDLAEGQRRVEIRRWRGVEHARGGSGTGPDLFPRRQSRARSQRPCARRRQPVHIGRGRAGCEDRQIPLALPAHASRHLGLRRLESRHPVRCDDQRAAAQGRVACAEVRLCLHPRPHHRQTAGGHRRAARAAAGLAEDFAHAAHSHRRRCDAAFHGRCAGRLRARQRRPHLHALR